MGGRRASQSRRAATAITATRKMGFASSTHPTVTILGGANPTQNSGICNMPVDPLYGTRIKIERAKEHVRDLAAEIQVFEAGDPYRVVTDDNTEPGFRLLRVAIVADIPGRWGAMVGDTVHNLRSSLDLLTSALAVANGRSSSGTYFPIRTDAQHFETSTSGKINKLSRTAKCRARRLTPYP